MTCEVAVMNKRGVALAADSAVTLGDGEKVYLTAEKLFPVSSPNGAGASIVPVGIMTYGAADIMGVPWETVVKRVGSDDGDPSSVSAISCRTRAASAWASTAWPSTSKSGSSTIGSEG